MSDGCRFCSVSASAERVSGGVARLSGRGGGGCAAGVGGGGWEVGKCGMEDNGGKYIPRS